jgi:UTP--glucose-1-phosphate uridylyltransferase
VRQQVPLGLGHAIWCARAIVGDEPFAIFLPDELMVGDSRRRRLHEADGRGL